MFTKLSDVPEAIREFYETITEEDTEIVSQIPFSECKTLNDVQAVATKHATNPDKHEVIFKFIEMYWEGCRKQYLEDYLAWLDNEAYLTSLIDSFVPAIDEEDNVIVSLEDYTKEINSQRVSEPTKPVKEVELGKVRVEGKTIEEYISLSTRYISVDNITVEVDGLIFDGNEESQRRMSSAISAMEDLGQDSIAWKLHGNSIQNISLAQLKEAHNKAILKQSSLWVL
jgi:hypothetical protein